MRSASPARTRRRGRRHGRATALVGIAVLLCGCAGSAGPSTAGGNSGAPSKIAEADDPGLGHIHGLGLNPADGAIYAATHFGVWRLPPPTVGPTTNETKPVRVADRFQDTMGFTVAGPDLFYGSGHPDAREDSPPHLGFIVSRDRAKTWESVALRGKADFHDLAAVGPRVYGYDSTTGTLRVSRDSGRTWQERAPRQIRDVTVDPSNADRILVTAREGLLSSKDAGASLRLVAGSPALVLVDWSRSALAGIDSTGTVWMAGGGKPDGEWKQAGRLTGPPHAFTVTTEGQFLAADESGVHVSTDSGRTWKLLTSYDGRGH